MCPGTLKESHPPQCWYISSVQWHARRCFAATQNLQALELAQAREQAWWSTGTEVGVRENWTPNPGNWESVFLSRVPPQMGESCSCSKFTQEKLWRGPHWHDTSRRLCSCWDFPAEAYLIREMPIQASFFISCKETHKRWSFENSPLPSPNCIPIRKLGEVTIGKKCGFFFFSCVFSNCSEGFINQGMQICSG